MSNLPNQRVNPPEEPPVPKSLERAAEGLRLLNEAACLFEQKGLLDCDLAYLFRRSIELATGFVEMAEANQGRVK